MIPKNVFLFTLFLFKVLLPEVLSCGYDYPPPHGPQLLLARQGIEIKPKFVQGVFLICEADHGDVHVDLYTSDTPDEVVKVSTTRQCSTTPVKGKTIGRPLANHAGLWDLVRGVRFVDLRAYFESLIVCPRNGVVSVVKEVHGGETETLASCKTGMEAHVVAFNMTKCPQVAP